MTADAVFPLTAALGEFVARLGEAPARARDVASVGIADAVGVMLAGRHLPVVAAVREFTLGGREEGEARVLLSSTRARAVEAATINAVAAHALAMDDVASGCHPSAMLMPALLAQGETQGASGAQVLDAYVAGYEVLTELAAREPDALHATGWHPSGLLGPVAVAAAVAHLLRLDAVRTAHALGIAASMTGGLQGNFGTATKALHAGRAAAAGLTAAHLAQQGVDAAADALEGPKGLLRTISPQGRVDVRSPLRAGREPRIVTEGLSIKKYPVCYSTHRIVDAAIGIARQPGFALEDVEAVEVTTGAQQAAMARHHRPRTVLEAKYSVEFAVASGLAAQAAGFAQLSDAFIASPAVQRLIAATAVAADAPPGGDDPIFAAADRVRVRLRGGRTLDSGDVRFARGHARSPLAADEVRAKFMDCATAGGWRDPAGLFGQLMGLADLADVRLLGGRPP